MADNQEKAPAMQSNPAGTDTSSSSRKRKAEMLIPEAPSAGEVSEPLCQFLFEKKLTHSDVKGQNRIIIPKAYAEKYFGEFAKMDSSSLIYMDDIRTGKKWKFCLRSWQNGGSRMYILEGTAKYTQEQDIKVGDYIMLYKDNQSDKYRISSRKQTEESLDNRPANGENVELPPSSSQVDFAGTIEVQASSSEVASVEDYHPQFLPEEETNQFIPQTDNIDPEYVMRKFNMTWDQFLNYNPFDD